MKLKSIGVWVGHSECSHLKWHQCFTIFFEDSSPLKGGFWPFSAPHRRISCCSEIIHVFSCCKWCYLLKWMRIGSGTEGRRHWLLRTLSYLEHWLHTVVCLLLIGWCQYFYSSVVWVQHYTGPRKVSSHDYSPLAFVNVAPSNEKPSVCSVPRRRSSDIIPSEVSERQ